MFSLETRGSLVALVVNAYVNPYLALDKYQGSLGCVMFKLLLLSALFFQDVKLKVVILEFIATAVETQPGLVELFLDLSSKENQVSCFVLLTTKI